MISVTLECTSHDVAVVDYAFCTLRYIVDSQRLHEPIRLVVTTIQDPSINDLLVILCLEEDHTIHDMQQVRWPASPPNVLPAKTLASLLVTALEEKLEP